MKDLPTLPSLSSIYPSYHSQLFPPVLSHHQQSSSPSPSFSFRKDSVQAVAQGLDDEDEDEDENGYFAGLAWWIVCSMLDDEDAVVVEEGEEEAFVSEGSGEDNCVHSPNQTEGEAFVELKVTKNDSSNCLNLPLDLPSSLLPRHEIEEELVSVTASLNAKEPQSMHKNSTKKKQKKKKRNQGKQRPTAKDEELIIHNSKVWNGVRRGGYEARAIHSSKKETWKDYRLPPAFSMHTLANRSNGRGSISSSGGTGVFLPRSYAPCTDASQTRSSLSCSIMHQTWPCLVSSPPEKEAVLPSPSYAAIAVGCRRCVSETVLPSLSCAAIAVGCRRHVSETVLPSPSYAAIAVGCKRCVSDWKPPPPFPSSLSSCSPLEHITADISLPMEWTY